MSSSNIVVRILIPLFVAVIAITAVLGIRKYAKADENKFSPQVEMLFENGPSLYEGDEAVHRIPSIISNGKGTLVAFANDRVNTVSDFAAQRYIVMSRSLDGGKTWSEKEYVLKTKGWIFQMGSSVYDAQTEKMMLFVQVSCTNEVYNSTPNNERYTRGINILSSTDDGVTWTMTPTVINAAQSFPYLVASTHGSASGIQIKEGEYAGRLIIPGKLSTAQEPASWSSSEEMKNWFQNYSYSTVIYSDDNGATWTTGGATVGGNNESSVCELPGGVLYLNCRNGTWTGTRGEAYSYDGGLTWTENAFAEELTEPCHGVSCSVLTVDKPDGDGYINVFFGCNSFDDSAGVNDWSAQRRKLSVWVSFDGCKTWPLMKEIYAYGSGYNSSCYDPVSKSFTVIFENGPRGGSYWANGIAISNFSYEELIGDFVPPVKDSGGCSSSIGAVSALSMLLPVSACYLLWRKK